MRGSDMEQLLFRIKTFFASPRCVLGLAVGIGILSTLLLMIVSPVYYRDSVVYMSMVSGFKVGDWEHAFDLAMTPLLPAMAGVLARIGVPIPEATTLISCLFCILAVFPVYGLLTFFMERKYAAWGALFFALMPKIIRYGFSPLLDSGRWLFVPLALYLIFCFVRRRKYVTLCWLGATFAALSLVRSEGVVYMAMLLGFMGLMLLQADKWKLSFRWIGRFVLYCLVVAGICLALCLPRLIQLYQATGYPALDTRQTWGVRGICHRIAVWTGAEESAAGEPVRASSTTYGSVNDFDFAWVTDWQFEKRFWKNMLDGCYIPYLILAVFGMILLFRRKEWRFDDSIMLLLLAANTVAFFLMRSAAGRYFFINAFFLMPFTVYGFREVLALVGRAPAKFRLPCLTAVALVVIGILQLWNGLDNLFPSKNDYFKTLGRELAAWQQGVTPRSGTRNINLLTIGDEYGWGVYAGANSFAYALRSIDKTWTLREIAEQGLPSDLTNYVSENLEGFDRLLPDLVVVANPDDVPPSLIAEIRMIPGVRQLHFPEDRKALFFQLGRSH